MQKQKGKRMNLNKGNNVGRVGVMDRLVRLNKAHRTLTTNEYGLLIANYKTSPTALQEQLEQVNTIVALSMVGGKEELEVYRDDVDQLAAQLLAHKDDIAYQDMIIELVSLYPYLKELFE